MFGKDFLKFSKGFSLIEMLVVVFIFSILGVVSTQIMALSLRGSKKVESVVDVRAEVEYSLSTMERLLRNAKKVSSCTSNKIDYIDEWGKSAFLECNISGKYIASNSASVRITSDRVKIDCSNVFYCPPPQEGVPQSILITLKGQNSTLGTGSEGSEVIVKTQFQLRVYDKF